MKELLFLIPAKGGSQRVKRKNIRYLGNKPLLAWTVESVKRCYVHGDIIVSTEDEEIAEVSKGLNVEIPFMRPGSLAKDPAGVVDVSLHALEALEKIGRFYKTLIILLPTSPFRQAKDIEDAYALYKKNGERFLMSISSYFHTPFAALKLDNGSLSPFFPNYIGKKSQEMPEAYRANGAITILNVEEFKYRRSYYVQPLIGYEMPWERSIDIDTEDDWKIAEIILKALHRKEAK